MDFNPEIEKGIELKLYYNENNFVVIEIINHRSNKINICPPGLHCCPILFFDKKNNIIHESYVSLDMDNIELNENESYSVMRCEYANVKNRKEAYKKISKKFQPTYIKLFNRRLNLYSNKLKLKNKNCISN